MVQEGKKDGGWKEILVMMMPLLFHLLNDRFLSSPSDVLSPRLRASLMHSTPLLCIRLACVELWRTRRNKIKEPLIFFSFSFKRASFLFLLFFKRREDGEKKRKRGQKKKCRHTPLNDRHLVHLVREISELDNIYKKRKGLASGRRWPVALPPAARTF